MQLRRPLSEVRVINRALSTLRAVAILAGVPAVAVPGIALAASPAKPPLPTEVVAMSIVMNAINTDETIIDNEIYTIFLEKERL